MAITLPKYSVFVVTNGISYDVTGAVTGLTLAEEEKQLAQSVTVKLANIVHNGSYLTSLFDVIDRVQVFATYDGKTDEVFRGFIWDNDYTSALEKTFTLPCYDNLIFLQKSDICEYFTAGKSTETICNSLCEKWGIDLLYLYRSISHPKLPLEGNFSTALIDDILDNVKKQTGAKYVIRGIKDAMTISEVGKNKTIYEVATKKNVSSVRKKKTMEDVVTQVVITGKKDDDDRTPIEATVKGKTGDYGTIQRTISKAEDTELSEAKAEAQEIIDENGEPKTLIYLEDVIDNPFVHKGDMIKVNAGNIVNKYCIVLSVTHDAIKKTMDITAEFAPNQETDETAASGGTASGKQLSLNGVPLYNSSDTKKKSTTVSGTYYLYDGIEVKGRYRITNSSSRVGKKPVGGNVTGWIDKEYV